MYRSSPLRSTLNTCDVCPRCRITHARKCKRMSSSPPHPTPPTWVEKMMIVPVTPECVRGWLWKMAVCARDSSLCARVTLGGKNDVKLCLCVLVLQSVCAGDPLTKKKQWSRWSRFLRNLRRLSPSIRPSILARCRAGKFLWLKVSLWETRKHPWSIPPGHDRGHQITYFGGMKQCKYTVYLKEFPYKGALLGW